MWTRSCLRMVTLSTLRGQWFVATPRGLMLDARRDGSSFSNIKKADGCFAKEAHGDSNKKADGVSDNKSDGKSGNEADGDCDKKADVNGGYDFLNQYYYNLEKDFKRLSQSYRTTDFDKALGAMPKPVFWAVGLSLCPLLYNTLAVGVTLSCGGYPSFVLSNVSMFVCAANALWQYDSPSLSSYWLVMKAVHPTVLCIATFWWPIPFLAQATVLYSSYAMTVRLTSDDHGSAATMPPWFKPLVLGVYGFCVPTLVLAATCSLFS
ncbi:Hypothetical protein CINCED_3A007386 [Cinara cedri]|uniref:Uncharacterized protein n=1 Tax=Cinara cedri TaxID=506608 RepID=A0A5E4MVK5_9HEMI|nr:Hypothetical protein CINCED_3A007386 [Cinara cedri]